MTWPSRSTATTSTGPTWKVFVAAPFGFVSEYRQLDKWILPAVDNILKLLMEEAGLPRLQTIQHLLALRHDYLDEELYAVMHTAAYAEKEAPPGFVCTLPFLHKLQGSLSPWSHQLQKTSKLILVLDGIHQVTKDALLAALPSFDCAILIGDPAQAASELPEPRTCSSDSDDDHVLEEACVTADLDLEACSLPKVVLNEVHHYGQTVVECLRAMAPSVWPQLRSAKACDTKVYPFVFNYLRDVTCEQDSRKIMRSKTLFVHAGVAIALELILGNVKEQVVCVTFRAGLLRQFREFMSLNLARIIKSVALFMHHFLGETWETTMEELERTCRLRFLTTRQAGQVGHIGASVALLLAMRQKDGDRSWEGALKHPKNLYIGLTRASARLYVFAEDLLTGSPQPCTNWANLIQWLVHHQTRECGSSEQIWSAMTLPPMYDVVWRDTTCEEGPVGGGVRNRDVRGVREEGSTAVWQQALEITAGCYDNYMVRHPLRTVATHNRRESLPQLVAKATLEPVTTPFKFKARKELVPPLPAPFASYIQPGQPQGQEVADTISSIWKRVAIDALTIHVAGPSRVLVTIPLNWHLCQQHKTAGTHVPEHYEYYEDCNHLAAALVREAVNTYNEKERQVPLSYAIKRHDKEQGFLDNMASTMVRYETDRPAFVGHTGHMEETMLYVYKATSLKMAHAHQQVLLGRCNNFLAAQALIATCRDLLGVVYREDSVRFPAPDYPHQNKWSTMWAFHFKDHGGGYPKRTGLLGKLPRNLEERQQLAQIRRIQSATPFLQSLDLPHTEYAAPGTACTDTAPRGWPLDR